MKIGVRKPSLKKSIKAKTTGKMKRAAKKSINPLYGKKGMGLINDPKKAMYNKVYNKTTIGVRNVLKDSIREENNINKDIDNDINIVSNDKTKMKNLLGINTKALYTPYKFILASIIFIFWGISNRSVFVISILLDIAAIAFLFSKKYLAAVWWNKAIKMYLKNNYVACKFCLERLPYSQKETYAYKKMISLINLED